MAPLQQVPLFSPPTLLSALVRVGTFMGRGVPMLNFVAGKVFLDESTPPPLRGYTPTRDDVFITTFAKSGTNWAMQMAQQIIGHGASEFEHIHEVVPWPEAPVKMSSMKDTSYRDNTPSGRRVIKTHLPHTVVPYGEDARYITVVRDPKEVIVSAYHFLGGLFGISDSITFDEWFHYLARGGTLIRAWSRHAAGYWQWRDRDNVLVLTYTEMKDDLEATIRRFARHLDEPLEEAAMTEIVRRCSFSYMKEHESKFAPPNFPLRRKAPMAQMVRRGQAGRSDEEMSPKQQAEVDDLCRAELARLGSALPYDALFGDAR